MASSSRTLRRPGWAEKDFFPWRQYTVIVFLIKSTGVIGKSLCEGLGKILQRKLSVL